MFNTNLTHELAIITWLFNLASASCKSSTCFYNWYWFFCISAICLFLTWKQASLLMLIPQPLALRRPGLSGPKTCARRSSFGLVDVDEVSPDSASSLAFFCKHEKTTHESYQHIRTKKTIHMNLFTHNCFSCLCIDCCTIFFGS